MKKVIFIVGPTSSGKSKLAIEIAKYFDCEIINADCFQVYKELNIGTNKPTIDLQENVKHHLIDDLSINDKWDIKKFKNSAENIIDNSNKTIIVVGGSNLYIHCLANNYDLSTPERSNIYSDLSSEELYDNLYSLNKELAIKIGINNKKRLERALENIKNNKNKSNLPIKYKTFFIFINPNRDELYKKINNRVDEMINQSWLDEIKYLVNKYDKNLNAFKAIGYNEIIKNNLSLNELIIEKIKKQTRNYAKRQVTWCKNKFKINILKENNLLLKEDVEKISLFLGDE